MHQRSEKFYGNFYSKITQRCDDRTGRLNFQPKRAITAFANLKYEKKIIIKNDPLYIIL